MAIVAVGVYAYTNPATGVGHDYADIQPCSNGQILKTSSGAWTCATDGAIWSAISGIPSGFADNIDNGKDCTWISVTPTPKYKKTSIRCPLGTTLAGGGCKLRDDDAILAGSYPLLDSNRWYCVEGDTSYGIETLYAYCCS